MGLRKISLFAVVGFALLVGSNGEEQDSEQERQPIKTFRTIYGEIIDCIDIYKQPAFDHPLLKNHKLQRKPSFLLNATKHGQTAQLKQQPERSHRLESCPDGTVPIRRTTKEDTMKAKSLAHTRPQIYHPQAPISPGFHVSSSPEDGAKFRYAYMEVDSIPNQPLFGAKAFIDVYRPSCEKGQHSTGQMWIEGGSADQLHIVQAGWRVDPDLYNDDLSHFFVYWTVDGGGNTGCFDLQCPGFVQVDKSVTIGGAIVNSSVYEGAQIEIHLQIGQDSLTKNWWLIYEEIGGAVGYWPANLFPGFASGATKLYYGGEVYSTQSNPSPPMGSGYFPDKSFTRACYFRQIHYMSGSHDYWIAAQDSRASAYTDSEQCYRASTIGDAGDFMGYTFLFGGPGGADC